MGTFQISDTLPIDRSYMLAKKKIPTSSYQFDSYAVIHPISNHENRVRKDARVWLLRRLLSIFAKSLSKMITQISCQNCINEAIFRYV